ncbi:MAG: nucleotide exchange factor GrpE [Oscillospiraceae bacterium]
MSKHKHSEKVEKEIKKAETNEKEVNFEELLAQEQKAHEELKQQFMRVAAEYDNFRKRSIKEKEQIYPEAISYAVSQFLTVADSAQAALALDIKDSECKKGIELINRSINTALANLKVEEFGAVGDIFDPQKHNAVLHVKDENLKEGEIVEVLQKGYLLNQKVIRHAMVKVAN